MVQFWSNGFSFFATTTAKIFLWHTYTANMLNR